MDEMVVKGNFPPRNHPTFLELFGLADPALNSWLAKQPAEPLAKESELGDRKRMRSESRSSNSNESTESKPSKRLKRETESSEAE